MAYKVSERAKSLFSQASIEPNIVFKIDGIDYSFGSRLIYHKAKFDQDGIYFDQPGLYFDGLVADATGKDWISLNGTSDSITQQLDIDKGGSTSTASLTIRVIDFNGEVSRIISPGSVIDDVLYKDAHVYLGPKDGDFDNDYILLLNGKISAVKSNSGSIDFTVAHPDDMKRNEIFIQAETVLTTDVNYKSRTIDQVYFQQYYYVTAAQSIIYVNDQSLGSEFITVAGNNTTIHKNAATTARAIKKLVEDDPAARQIYLVKIAGNGDLAQASTGTFAMLTDSEIFVDDASLFLTPVSPIFKTYALINSELLEYTGVDYALNKLTGCTREQLNSLGSNHEIDDEVKSFYRLGDGTFTNGNPINLSLWVMLSGGDEYFKTSLDANKINFVGAVDKVQNAIFFNGYDVKKLFGLTVGDKVKVTDSAIGGNNFVDRSIVSFGTNELGSWFVVDGATLTDENDTLALVSLKSQYRILPSGCGLTPAQVDVDQFNYIKKTFSTQLHKYDLYIKESVQAKELINEKILYPSGLYSISRQGRVSVGVTSPALYGSTSQVLDLTNVKNPAALKIDRSINNNFANAVLWKFDIDSITDKFLGGDLALSALSTNRIKAPTKAMKIEAPGLRKSQSTINSIQATSNRFLTRYQYGAEAFNDVEVVFGTGWTIEIGDAVIFGDSQLQLTDSKAGVRGLKPRVWEVQNKAMNYKTGSIRLKLVDTSFGANTRYGVFSPASKLAAGSTTTQVKVKSSFNYDGIEINKWVNYVGSDVLIHSKDYTYSQVNKITSILVGSSDTLILDTALPSAPLEDYIIKLAKYDDISLDDTFLKAAHCWFNPTLTVTSGTSNLIFNVSAPDAAKLFVGSLVRVRNIDYTIDSGKTGIEVVDITGTQITVKTTLGFTPAAGQLVDLVGFAIDQGAPYVFL